MTNKPNKVRDKKKVVILTNLLFSNIISRRTIIRLKEIGRFFTNRSKRISNPVIVIKVNTFREDKSLLKEFRTFYKVFYRVEKKKPIYISLYNILVNSIYLS